ncbi:ECF transporter S component [Enterococcus alishanensis]|nr:ECF transporter S component [Enterococcus alishanensis]
MTNHKKIQTIVFVALFAALTFCGTMIKIPLPTGMFIHFGNTVVLLAVLLLGYWRGALAGGIGFALFDILNGYASEAPIYFVECFVVGAAAYFGFWLFKKDPTKIYQIITIAFFAGIAKFIASVIEATMMSMIAGADLKPAFMASIISMPATVINIVSTIIITSLLYFPLKSAMKGILHKQTI